MTIDCAVVYFLQIICKILQVFFFITMVMNKKNGAYKTVRYIEVIKSESCQYLIICSLFVKDILLQLIY